MPMCLMPPASDEAWGGYFVVLGPLASIGVVHGRCIPQVCRKWGGKQGASAIYTASVRRSWDGGLPGFVLHIPFLAMQRITITACGRSAAAIAGAGLAGGAGLRAGAARPQPQVAGDGRCRQV